MLIPPAEMSRTYPPLCPVAEESILMTISPACAALSLPYTIVSGEDVGIFFAASTEEAVCT